MFQTKSKPKAVRNMSKKDSAKKHQTKQQGTAYRGCPEVLTGIETLRFDNLMH
jgi:hypothetical protein